MRKMGIQHDYVPLLLLIDKLNNEEAKQCFDWFILREYHNGYIVLIKDEF